MTASEAIKELHEIRLRCGIIPQERAEDLDMAIQALENQINRCWVPCKDRLPEEIDKYYLVTCRSVICGEFEQFTTVSYFSTFSNGDKS